MRILICSYSFFPKVGGIEVCSHILATEFSRLGHDVRVVTMSPGEDLDNSTAYMIVRRPSFFGLFLLALECDVVLQNNISLNMLPPLMMSFRPMIIIHQTWISRLDGAVSWRYRLKRFVLRFVKNISISNAIAASLSVSSEIIYNPFEEALFSSVSNAQYRKGLIFVGRLVVDKGCDLLVTALGVLRDAGIFSDLTIVGDGPERQNLEQLAEELQLSDRIRFLGEMKEERAAIIAEHAIMVVPSRWSEPFGIVALEGIAAGCVVVASSGGGLPDAIGPCGLLFRNNDLDGLVKILADLLNGKERHDVFLSRRGEHLSKFTPAVVAGRYMEVINAIVD